MQFSQAKQGRIFILRMEHGDKIPETIEQFAKAHEIRAAAVWFVGGADKDSKIVVGPEDGEAVRPIPVIAGLPGVCEAFGFGTIITNESQEPILHLHGSFGRGEASRTGCTRAGIDIWHIGEVFVMELIEHDAIRRINPASGFELLEMLKKD